MLYILCNNCCLFCLRSLTPDWLGVISTQCRSSFPPPNKIDNFVHNDGDRKTKLLSPSLQYHFVNITPRFMRTPLSLTRALSVRKIFFSFLVEINFIGRSVNSIDIFTQSSSC